MSDSTQQDRAQQELGYYKRRVDELAGENLRLDYAISGLRHELKQKKQGFALLSNLQQSIGGHQQISSIFEITIAAINATLGMDKTVVMMPAEKEHGYQPRHWVGFRSETVEGFASRVLRFPESFADGSGVLLVNQATEPTPLIKELREAFNLPFFICLPVIGEKGPISLLLTGRLKEAKPIFPPLDEGDVDTLQAIAGLISASVRNMRVAVLEEMDRLKTEFFANISHEFRTPIALSIGPLGQILKGRYGALPESIAEQLQMIWRNQERLLGLINQILDLARLEAGGLKLKAAPIPDLNAFIEKCVDDFRPHAEARGLTLTFEPEAAVSGVDVYLDREKFDKVVSNLLSNAVKFTREGSITCSTSLEAGRVRLNVSDTGIGIKDDQLPHIFDRFRQADGSASREYAGTGIGLALAKEIVSLHGGEISVFSRYGEGTTFHISIPLGASHLSPSSIVDFDDFDEDIETPFAPLVVAEGATDVEGVEALNRLAEEHYDANRPTILYAEDNPDLRRYIRDLLRDDYNVFLAPDGREGLDQIRRSKPDLVLVDQMMPNMSGRDLLAAIRSDEHIRHLPVIFLTARAGSDVRVESLEAGADDYLTKPFEEDELLARIRNQLRIREQARKLRTLTDQLRRQRDDLEHALAELQSAQTQLIQSEKMASLGRLAAGVAHEIRNPLNFINNFAVLSADLVRDLEGALTEKAPDIEELLNDLSMNVQKIEDHGKRIDGIVRSMLEHSRSGPSERRMVLLNELVDEYVNLSYHAMRAQMPDSKIDVERDYDPEAGEIELSTEDIGRVFINLLNNAFYAVQQRARSDGTAYVPRVCVQTKKNAAAVEIRIRDNGVGMPDSVRSRIFEPFFTTKPAGSGTGLGLSLSYDIVTQLHSGDIEVESSEKSGTEFVVRLPAA